MSYSFTERTGDGVATTFNFQFAGKGKGYLLASDVTVYFINGNPTPVTGWSLTGTNQITFLTPPANGQKMYIRRVVGKENPFAEFDRGPVLDMASLNNSLIHLLEVSQELLDGFYPDGFYFKQDLDMGGHKIVNLGNGVDPQDATTQGQLDLVDQVQTEWNTQQDIQIQGILNSFVTGVSHRSTPWTYMGLGGETTLSPPYIFNSALVHRDGVFQDMLAGAFEIVNNQILLANPPLRVGERVSVLVGSYPTPYDPGTWTWFDGIPISNGTTSYDAGVALDGIDELFLDGLKQSASLYSVAGTVINFNTPLPECTLSARVQLT